MNAIAILNDQFRKAGPSSDWLMTAGVRAMTAGDLQWVILTVIDYREFGRGNDPHGEHDFGTFMIDDERLFWKIDYYDRYGITRGSEDPADATVTRRVLTIMLASEY